MSRHKSFLVCLIIITFLHNRLCPEAARSGSSNKSRISNGEEVPEGKWPFMAAIFYDGYEEIHCGGSVLNDDSILTTAQCLFFDNGEMASAARLTVYLGHVDLEGDKDEAYLFQADKLFIHEQWHYDDYNGGHNVAVIKLARTIDFSALENVAPVCLPDYDTYPQWDQCIIMGWGYTEAGYSSTKLIQADVSMQTDEVCWDLNSAYQPETTLCAGNAEDGKDWCDRDQGSPLVCPVEYSEGEDDDDEQSTYLQYGMPSHSFGACGDKPEFYTRVRTLVDFIMKVAEA